MLRTPLLPLATLTDGSPGSTGRAAAKAMSGTLEDAIAGDRLRLRSRLEEIVTEPAFREAVFVASPSLEAAIDVVAQGPRQRARPARGGRAGRLSHAGGRAADAVRPVRRLHDRNHRRLPPRLRLPGRAGYRRHTRLDMDYLWTLAKAIEADPLLRAGLRYRPNSSLYEVGDRLLYAEARDRRPGRSYHLVAGRQDAVPDADPGPRP